MPMQKIIVPSFLVSDVRPFKNRKKNLVHAIPQYFYISLQQASASLLLPIGDPRD